MKEQEAFDYLKGLSSCPGLYEKWDRFNRSLFDSSLKPIPIIVGLSNYGKALAFCSMDHIAIQPHAFMAGSWAGILVHEMCHQADHADGLTYESFGRTRNVHNTPTWCNRINSVMEKMGDSRYAIPYRRNRKGEMVAAGLPPNGTTLIPFDQLKSWEPDPALLAL